MSDNSLIKNEVQGVDVKEQVQNIEKNIQQQVSISSPKKEQKGINKISNARVKKRRSDLVLKSAIFSQILINDLVFRFSFSRRGLVQFKSQVTKDKFNLIKKAISATRKLKRQIKTKQNKTKRGINSTRKTKRGINSTRKTKRGINSTRKTKRSMNVDGKKPRRRKLAAKAKSQARKVSSRRRKSRYSSRRKNSS